PEPRAVDDVDEPLPLVSDTDETSVLDVATSPQQSTPSRKAARAQQRSAIPTPREEPPQAEPAARLGQAAVRAAEGTAVNVTSARALSRRACPRLLGCSTEWTAASSCRPPTC